MRIITLLLCSLTAALYGQATYTSANFASVGDSFYITTPEPSALQLDYTVTGAGIAWDYSALVPQTQELIAWSNPNDSGYKTVWCFLNGFFFNCNSQFNTNFNLANTATEGLVLQGFGLTNVVNHLNKTNAALQNKMIGAQVTLNGTTVPFVVSYTDPDDLYQFPMNFGNTATQPFAINANLSSFGFPVQIQSTGQRTNLVEGWGTLVTPFGSFANVLKLKSTLVQTTTITVDGTPQTTTTTTVSYQWFDPAHKIPVLEASGNLVNNQWVPTTVRFMDIQRCLTPQAAFAYVPVQPDFNPTNNGVTVNFVNLSSNYMASSWDFGDNTPVSTLENPSHTFVCPGLQEVTLTVTNTFCEPDQVNTFTIPVFVSDSQNAFTTSVTVTDTQLSADRTLTGTTYQWLDCDNNNAPIPNATGQVFTPTADGNYAVQLSTNGCVAVSDCYPFAALGNTGFTQGNSRLVPNPTTGVFSITGVASAQIQKIVVWDLLGKPVAYSTDISHLTAGWYMVQWETDEGVFHQKIIKQ